MPTSTPNPQQPRPARTTPRDADAVRALGLLGLVDHGQVATSRQALPYLAAARHVVVGGRLVLRMHRGHGHHRSCVGSIVAYGAAGPAVPGQARWSVQVVGECALAEPTPEERELFGPPPRLADGEPFDAVYVRVEPEFATIRTTD